MRMFNGTLFTEAFLGEGICETDAWKNLSDGVLSDTRAYFKKLFNEFPTSGKDDVENDGEGELQPGNKEGIEIHEFNPRTSVDEPCAVVTLIRREWPMDTAGARRAGPSQARLRAIDRDVPWPS